MKKRLFSGMMVLVLCLICVIPSFAAEEDPDRLLDMADLLTSSQEERIREELDRISQNWKVDLVIVTVDTLGGYTVQEMADGIYDASGYGFGANRDGLLLLISMEDRDWYISTCGYGITAFTDTGINYIGEKITPYLSDGDYLKAFETYAELCDDFIRQAKTGSPYDRGSLPKEPLSLIWIPLSLIIGFVIALIVVGTMKASLRSVRSKAGAEDYVRRNSTQITAAQDLFLYRKVTRIPRPKENTGSNVHRSSSGTTHGGGGGKF